MANLSPVLEEDLTPNRGTALTFRITTGTAVVAIAAILSIGSFVYFFLNGMTNVYGDGVAHLNIARKVIDSPDNSIWQRYIQIGSPWLPLHTVLMMPLVANDWMWRSGAAGSIISMLCFVVAAYFLYRLSRRFYEADQLSGNSYLPLLSVAVFCLNPSLLYIQSTPLTEVLFIASLIGSIYALQCWVDEQSIRRLIVAGSVMALSTLTRYEAWPVAALSVLVVLISFNGSRAHRIKECAIYTGLVAIGPVYWLWHNYAIYGNAIEFLTGASSARGIYLQNRSNLGWSRILVGNLPLDFATIACALAVCAGPLVLIIASAGFIWWIAHFRKSLRTRLAYLLLGVPFLFHAFSLYRGEIQIFPFSAFGLLNVRYGLPHVAAVALFLPALVLSFPKSVQMLASTGMVIAIILQYGFLISEGASQLAVYQEGYRNGVNSKAAREISKVSSYVRQHPADGLTLMNTGSLGPVVSQGGMIFAKVIHEGSARWHQLAEQGIPADVSTVIVRSGDPLDIRLQSEYLLKRDLNGQFKPELEVGSISVFRRFAKK